jgi:hypothetical protein
MTVKIKKDAHSIPLRIIRTSFSGFGNQQPVVNFSLPLVICSKTGDVAPGVRWWIV